MKMKQWMSILVLFLWGAALGGVNIRFNPQCELPAGDIRLKDISSISGDQSAVSALSSLKIGVTDPRPGGKRIVNTHSIARFYIANIYPLDSIEFEKEGRIEVITRSYKPEPDSIKNILKEWLKHEKLPDDEARYAIDIDRVPEIHLPVDKHTLLWESSVSFRDEGTQMIRLEVRQDQKRVHRYQIPVYISKYKKIPVAARTIPRGRKLVEDDIEMKEVDVSRIRRSFFESKEQVLRSEARRTIDNGKIFSVSYLERPWLVEKGQKVKIFTQVGQSVLSVQGTARQNGRAGSRIKVMNDNSRATLMAKVDDQGKLWVEN